MEKCHFEMNEINAWKIASLCCRLCYAGKWSKIWHFCQQYSRYCLFLIRHYGFNDNVVHTIVQAQWKRASMNRCTHTNRRCDVVPGIIRLGSSALQQRCYPPNSKNDVGETAYEYRYHIRWHERNGETKIDLALRAVAVRR